MPFIFFLLFLQAGNSGARRVMIADFQNAGTLKDSDHIAEGVSAMLHQQFKSVPGLKLVNRDNIPLLQLQREVRIGLSLSPLVLPGSTMQAGYVLPAEYILAGKFWLTAREIHLNATIESITSEELVNVSVTGTRSDIRRVEADLANQLIEKLLGTPSVFQPPTDSGVLAFKAFSEGVYLTRKNDLKSALSRFDQALKLDPFYTEAEFERALVLKKLQRLDESIASLKALVPAARTKPRVTETLNIPADASAETGILPVIDLVRRRITGNLEQRAVLFTELKGDSTTVYLPDLDRHRVEAIELQGRASFRNVGLANDRFTLIETRTGMSILHLYGIGPGGSRKWQRELLQVNGELPRFGTTPAGYYTHDLLRHLEVFDDDNRLLWNKDDVVLDRSFLPIVAGDFFIIKGGGVYRALRLSDGSDAWSLPVAGNTAEWIGARTLIVLEPGKGLSFVSFETGNVVPAVSDTIVNLKVAGDRLYVVTLKQEVLCLDLKRHRELWRTPPVGGKITALAASLKYLFIGTDNGAVMTFNLDGHVIRDPIKLSGRSLRFDYAGDDFVIATSDRALYGFDSSGRKQWEYPRAAMPSNATLVFKGAVMTQTSPNTITTLDARTGEMLWNKIGESGDVAHMTADGLFVVERHAVKRFSTEIASREDHRPVDKDVLVELIGALKEKGDEESADFYFDRMNEIDPDYPSFRLLMQDFATYANLVGRTTTAGQSAIAEMKKKQGLFWTAELDGAHKGPAVVSGNRLINLARATGDNLRLSGLDIATGKRWSAAADRFVATVQDEKGNVWYAAGDKANAEKVYLRSIDAETGNVFNHASWNADLGFPVQEAWMTAGSGRIYVASLAVNKAMSMAFARIDAFNATGEFLWKQSLQVTLPATELVPSLPPIRLFAVQGENLIYIFGREIRAVHGSDGTVLDQQTVNFIIGPTVPHQPLPEGPVYFAAFGDRIGAYDVAAKTVVLAPVPEMDSPQLEMNGSTLFAFLQSSAFAYDLKDGEKWRVPGRFTQVIRIGTSVYALRNDNTVVEIDAEHGTVLQEFPTRWPVSSFTVADGTFFGFTADGLAFALKPVSPPYKEGVAKPAGFRGLKPPDYL